jgi:hypothetical protein
MDGVPGERTPTINGMIWDELSAAPELAASRRILSVSSFILTIIGPFRLRGLCWRNVGGFIIDRRARFLRPSGELGLPFRLAFGRLGLDAVVAFD